MPVQRVAAARAGKMIVEHRQGVRQAKAIEKNRTLERAKLRNYYTIEAQAQEKQILAARTKEYRSRRGEQESHDAARAGRSRVTSAVSSGAAPVKGGINYIMLILVTMFLLIAFYAMVTKPQPTATFFGSLGDWLSLLSTSNPLFEKRTA